MINSDSFKIILPEDFSLNIKDNTKTIIFWDACGVLDILNLISDSTNSHFLTILLNLNNKISTGEIISCSSKIVIKEILDNYEKFPYSNAKKFIDDTIKNYNKIQSYNQAIGQQDSFEEVVINSEALLNIVERQIQLLLDNTIFIDDDNYLKKARDRVVEKIPPSQRNEFKDSVIWETCLDLTNYVTNIDFYFISSNEKDYGKSDNRFDRIQSDIEEFNIIFKHKIYDLYSIVIESAG